MKLRALFAHAAPWTVAVQALEVAAQVGTSLIVARTLGPEGLGVLSFALNLSGLAAVLVLFGAQDVLLTAFARRTVAVERVLGAGLVVLAAGTLAATALVGAVCAATGVRGEALVTVALVLVALAGNGLSSLFNMALVAAGASREDLPRHAASRLLLVALAAGGALLGSVPLAAGAYAVSAWVLAASRGRLAARRCTATGRLRPSFNVDVVRHIWRESRFVGVGHLFGVVSSRSDLILLEAWRTTAEVGLYGAAYRLLHAAGQAATATALALYPGVVRGAGASEGRRARARFLGVGGALALGLLLVALLGDRPLVWLYGPAFSHARGLLPLLLVGGALQVLGVFVAKLVLLAGRARALPLAQALAASTNIALNVWLIPTLGIHGCAWATLGAEAMLMIVLVLALLRPRHAAAVRVSAVAPAPAR